ncbi:MAG: hypothetical protein LIO56_04750 [Lachnospiraceae bacterium]|nr:hypothetical protein [Lachnospiraceae bacterium]
MGVKAFFSDMELTAQCVYIADLEELLKNRDLLEVSAPLLRYPAILFDASFEVIAYTNQGEFGALYRVAGLRECLARGNP